MKAAWSGILGLAVVAAVLSACDGGSTVVVPPPDTAGTVQVSVVPKTAFVPINFTQQLTAVVTGITNQTVTWSSSSNAIATVSATGLVTGRVPGTAVITAVSQADPRARDASAVTVLAIVDFTIVITRITTGNTNTPVQTQNISGQIDITAEVNLPPTVPVQRIEFLLDNVVQPNCTQTFQAGGSAELETSSAMIPVLCSINTAAFNATTGAPTFANGPHRVSVQVVAPSGTVTASTGQDLRFNNPNFIMASPTFSKTCQTASASPGPGNLAPGQLWCGGDLKFTFLPVIFSTAADRPASYTVTLMTGGSSAVPGGTGSNGVPAPGCTTVGAPTPNCAAVAISKTTSAGDTVTFAGGTVATASSADIAAVEDILASVMVTSVTTGGQIGPVCINPDPARNPLTSTVPNAACGTGAGAPGNGTAPNVALLQNPIRIDNLPPRVTLFDLTVGTLGCLPAPPTPVPSGCFVNASFSFAERAGFFVTVDYGVDGQTASFRAGTLATTLQAVTSGADLAETAVPTLTVAGITTDRLANSDTLFAGTNAAAPLQTAVGAQLLGIDKTPPKITTVTGPLNNSANAGNAWNVSFVDTAAPPAGPSGFSAMPVRIKLEQILASGTACLNPNAPNLPLANCTTNGGFVNDDGSVAIPAAPAYYRLTARVVDEAGNVGTDSMRVTLIDLTPPTTGGVVAPSALVGGQSATFSVSIQDNVDFGDVQAALDYGIISGIPTLLGSPRTVVGSYGPDAFVVASNATLTVNSFVRGVEGTLASGRPTGTINPANAVQFSVRDAAGVQNTVPCPPAPFNCAQSPPQSILPNVTAGGLPQSFTLSNPVFASANPAHGLFLQAAPGNPTVCNGDPLGPSATQPCTNPTSTTLVATVTGPTGTFANPFSRVEFYHFDALGRAQLAGTATVGASDNTILGARTFTYTLVWTPTGVAPTPSLVFALGINGNGDALRSGLRPLIISID